jgi:hypothetical protein
MGATADGKKELIAIADGYRESEQSWKELLLGVKGLLTERAVPGSFRSPGTPGAIDAPHAA